MDKVSRELASTFEWVEKRIRWSHSAIGSCCQWVAEEDAWKIWAWYVCLIVAMLVVLAVVVHGHVCHPACLVSCLNLLLIANKDDYFGILFFPINTICTIQVKHQYKHSNSFFFFCTFTLSFLLLCNFSLSDFIFHINCFSGWLRNPRLRSKDPFLALIDWLGNHRARISRRLSQHQLV